GIPDFAEGDFLGKAHAVLLERQGDLAAMVRVMRDEVAHPADGFALKEPDALAGLQPFAEEGFDGRARCTEGGGQTLAIELRVAVERPGVAREAPAVVL